MYREYLTALEDTFEIPIVLVASRWQAERAVDLADEAGRVFLEVFEHLPGEYDRPPEELGLFLVGRGGRPSFFNIVRRILRGHDIRFRCLVPSVVTGAYSLLALASDEVVCHPFGGLGAYDVPPSRTLSGRLDLETLAALRPHRDDGGPEEVGEAYPRLAQTAHLRNLARHQLEHAVGGTESGVGARVAREMTVDRLGRNLGFGPEELDEIGVEARRADEAEIEVMWRLYREVEQDLQLRGPAVRRYTESDIGEEVEFERAQSITGAVIESAYSSAIYEVDTGQPDPETNMFDGHWTTVEAIQPEE